MHNKLAYQTKQDAYSIGYGRTATANLRKNADRMQKTSTCHFPAGQMQNGHKTRAATKCWHAATVNADTVGNAVPRNRTFQFPCQAAMRHKKPKITQK
ncbi:MAG: hypothetical protein Q4A06_06355 [Cardiobacteriaceae bacterium]|nr:hypothetical protein [Cardiobacteriaceae bacterium]